ncbi:MAG: hypothetical protein GXP27_16650 [Planctomycetes bacterium]|nr:hypothetical protein [Planctomycetota bacterium]
MGEKHFVRGSSFGELQRWGDEDSVEVMLITCTDPSLDFSLLSEFRSVPLLLWRCPGVVVPPYGKAGPEVEQILEHAVNDLGVREIVVCGHLPNERLRAFLAEQEGAEQEADPSGRALRSICHVVRAKCGHLAPDQLLQTIVEENVLLQAANLRTYPAVLAAVVRGQLQIHTWIYDLEHEVLYVRGSKNSLLLNRSRRFVPPPRRLLPSYDPCDIYLA